MEKLTYPREWFRLFRWSNDIKAKMFDRETEHRLYYGKHWEPKASDGITWFPTIEDAQAAIEAREARKAKDKADRLIRNAAPELLEALEELLSSCGEASMDGYVENSIHSDDVAKARAAIAKARGQ